MGLHTCQNGQVAAANRSYLQMQNQDQFGSNQHYVKLLTDKNEA
jgi:hypothetical protein